MSEFNEGDLVKAVKGEFVTVARVTTLPSTGELCLPRNPEQTPEQWTFIAWLKHPENGYTLRTIEKAAPKLPTEPGAYHDRDGDLWVLVGDGSWVDYSGAYGADWDAPPSRYAPLTRLEPVPVSARRFADALRASVWPHIESHWYTSATARGILDQANKIAAEFGATE